MVITFQKVVKHEKKLKTTGIKKGLQEILKSRFFIVIIK